MVDQVVKVRGKVLWVVPNPGGLGGLYLKLGNGEGEVGVRIQDKIWKTLKVPPVFPLIRLPSPIGPVPFVLSPPRGTRTIIGQVRIPKARLKVLSIVQFALSRGIRTSVD